ncbi:hypothetical protein CDAR_306451 [Caerostris darwini]|uniref:Uncharacterized protein n=1 Tax=Caerostris darwini TaxID=1538125 RepID=A0AAV4SX19_9ARAC|nr:hypothetical protein CDAR_306451 [Caerostris darwini]
MECPEWKILSCRTGQWLTYSDGGAILSKIYGKIYMEAYKMVRLVGFAIYSGGRKEEKTEQMTSNRQNGRHGVYLRDFLSRRQRKSCLQSKRLNKRKENSGI